MIQPWKPASGEEERDLRIASSRYAVESTAMEGGTLHSETLAALALWAESELTDDELVRSIIDRFKPGTGTRSWPGRADILSSG